VQPAQVDWGCEHSLILDVEGDVWVAGRCRDFPSNLTFQQVLELLPVTSVAAGSTHSAAIDTNGDLWGVDEPDWSLLGEISPTPS
jgi:alpha-tubulin suppressor-like RCC1 family protein